jgi:hypothetical protein
MLLLLPPQGRVSGMLHNIPVYAVMVEDLGERGALYTALRLLQEEVATAQCVRASAPAAATAPASCKATACAAQGGCACGCAAGGVCNCKGGACAAQKSGCGCGCDGAAGGACQCKAAARTECFLTLAVAAAVMIGMAYTYKRNA